MFKKPVPARLIYDPGGDDKDDVMILLLKIETDPSIIVIKMICQEQQTHTSTFQSSQTNVMKICLLVSFMFLFVNGAKKQKSLANPYQKVQLLRNLLMLTGKFFSKSPAVEESIDDNETCKKVKNKQQKIKCEPKLKPRSEQRLSKATIGHW